MHKIGQNKNANLKKKGFILCNKMGKNRRKVHIGKKITFFAISHIKSFLPSYIICIPIYLSFSQNMLALYACILVCYFLSHVTFTCIYVGKTLFPVHFQCNPENILNILNLSFFFVCLPSSN